MSFFEALAAVAGGNLGVIIFPVGYQAVRAAAEAYRTALRGEEAKELIYRFVQKYAKYEPGIVDAVYPLGDKSAPQEDVVIDRLLKLAYPKVAAVEAEAALAGQSVYYAGNGQGQVTLTDSEAKGILAAIQDPTLVGLVEQTLRLAGEVHAAQQISPMADFGILSGDSLSAAGIQLNRPIHEIVLELDSHLRFGRTAATPITAYQTRPGPNSWRSVVPTVELGPQVDDEGNLTNKKAILAVVGKADETYGLFPMTDMLFQYGGKTVVRADEQEVDPEELITTSAVAEGILRETIASGMWHLSGFDADGRQQWAWRGDIQFAYPAPVQLSDKEPPITGNVEKLIAFVQESVTEYVGVYRSTRIRIQVYTKPSGKVAGAGVALFGDHSVAFQAKTGMAKGQRMALFLNGTGFEGTLIAPPAEGAPAEFLARVATSAGLLEIPLIELEPSVSEQPRIGSGFARLLRQAAAALVKQAQMFPASAASFLSSALKEGFFPIFKAQEEVARIVKAYPSVDYDYDRAVQDLESLRPALDPAVVSQWLAESALFEGRTLNQLEDEELYALMTLMRRTSETKKHWWSWSGHRRLTQEWPIQSAMMQEYRKIADLYGTSQRPGPIRLALDALSADVEMLDIPSAEFALPLVSSGRDVAISKQTAARIVRTQLFRDTGLPKSIIRDISAGIVRDLDGVTFEAPSYSFPSTFALEVWQREGKGGSPLFSVIGRQQDGSIEVQAKLGRADQPTMRLFLPRDTLLGLASGRLVWEKVGRGELDLDPSLPGRHSRDVINFLFGSGVNFDAVAETLAEQGSQQEGLLYAGFTAETMPADVVKEITEGRRDRRRGEAEMGVPLPVIEPRFRVDVDTIRTSENQVVPLNAQVLSYYGNNPDLTMFVPESSPLAKKLGERTFVVATQATQPTYQVYQVKLLAPEALNGFLLYSVARLPLKPALSVLIGASRRATLADDRRVTIDRNLSIELLIPFTQLMQSVYRLPLVQALGDLIPPPESGLLPVPRFLPIVGDTSWFGDNDVVRSLALVTERTRADLAGDGGANGIVSRGIERPPTLKFLSALSFLEPSVYEKDYPAFSRAIQRVREKSVDPSSVANKLSMEVYDSLEDRKDQYQLEREVWKLVHAKSRAVPDSVPIIDGDNKAANRILDSIVFTVYGFIDAKAKTAMHMRGARANPVSLELLRNEKVESEYGVFWQSPVITKDGLVRIVEQIRAESPEPPPLGPVLVEDIERPIDYPMPAYARKAVLSRQKSLDVLSLRDARKVKLVPGEAGIAGQTQPMLVRYRGPLSFDDLLKDISEDENTAFEEFVAQEFNTSFDPNKKQLRPVANRKELAAITADPERKRWILGQGKMAVFDLTTPTMTEDGLEIADFPMTTGRALEFNPAAAVMTWIGRQSGLTSLAEAWERATEEGSGSGEVFAETNPVARLNKKRKESLPLPFFVVGTMLVNRKLADFSGLKLAKTFALGAGNRSPYGLGLTRLFVPSSGGTIPSSALLKSPYTPTTTPTGFVLKTLTQGVIPKLAVNFGRVNFGEKAGKVFLEPQLSRGGQDGLNLFSYQNLLRDEMFVADVRRAIQKNEETEERAKQEEEQGISKKERKARPLSLGQIVNRQYIRFLQFGLSDSGPSKEAPEIAGARRGYAAVSGAYRGKGRRVASGALVSPERSELVMATDQPVPFSDVFVWIARLCDMTGLSSGFEATGARASGSSRYRVSKPEFELVQLPFADEERAYIISGVKQATIEDPFSVTLPKRPPFTDLLTSGQKFATIAAADESVTVELIASDEGDSIQLSMVESALPDESSAQSEEDQRIEYLLGKYGIEMSDSDLAARRAALQQLSVEMERDFHYKMNMGLIPRQVAEWKQQAAESGEDADQWDYAEEVMGELARPNQGRRPRRQRYRESKANPLPKGAAQTIKDWSIKRKSPELAEEIDKAIQTGVRSSGRAPESWEVSSQLVGEVFPRRGNVKETWNLGQRADALERYDVVSSMGPVQLDGILEKVSQDLASTVTVAQLRRAITTGETLLGDRAFTDKLMKIIQMQSGLSFSEMDAVLQSQKAKKASDRTIPASSAMGKLYRTRRMTQYTLPPEVVQVAGPRAVIVWLSPKQVSAPRVMTFKRGMHIDSDMTNKGQVESLTEMMGRAVRSILYWIAEKPKKRGDTFVWVGRVGEPKLYLAWQPGDPLSMERFALNLRNAVFAPADQGRARDLYSAEMADKKTKLDLKNYLDSAALLDPDFAASFVAPPTPPMPSSVDMPPSPITRFPGFPQVTPVERIDETLDESSTPPKEEKQTSKRGAQAKRRPKTGE